jgi:hypothetical protein
MADPFGIILIMCAATGVAMVLGSMFLLYCGVIKLSEKAGVSALEAQFKNEIRVNIRNPALGLFAIGFFFFCLALYFAKAQEGTPVVVSGHIKIADVSGLTVSLEADQSPIAVSSEGEIFTTIQPLEKLKIEIKADGYKPHTWVHQLTPAEARNGHLQLPTAEFTPVAGVFLAKPQ